MLQPTPKNMKASADRINMLIDWMLEEQEKLPEKPKADSIDLIADIYGHFAQELAEAQGMMRIAAQVMRKRETEQEANSHPNCRSFIQPAPRHGRTQAHEDFERFLEERGLINKEEDDKNE